MKETGFKIESLQAGRAVAALLVMFYHADQHLHDAYGVAFLGNAFRSGYAGVDFFFVLSGFIIMYTSGSWIGKPQMALEFCKKRFVRIYPIYWVFLSMILLVSLIAPKLVGTSKSALTSLNIAESYLLVIGHKPILITSWTLSHEVLFYLCFLLLIISARLGAWVAATLLTITAIQSILQLSEYKGPIVPGSTFGKIVSVSNLEFALGAVASIIWRRLSIKTALHLLLLGSIGMIGGLFLVPSEHINTVRESLLTVLVYGIPSFLIILSLVRLEAAGKVSVPGVLYALGGSSYTLYLIHTVVLTGLRKGLMDHSHVLKAYPSLFYCLFGLITVVICHLTSIYVEMPLTGFVNRTLSARMKGSIAAAHSPDSGSQRG